MPRELGTVPRIEHAFPRCEAKLILHPLSLRLRSTRLECFFLENWLLNEQLFSNWTLRLERLQSKGHECAVVAQKIILGSLSSLCCFGGITGCRVHIELGFTQGVTEVQSQTRDSPLHQGTRLCMSGRSPFFLDSPSGSRIDGKPVVVKAR